MRLGLDAMGGDFGPKVTLEGAIEAAQMLPEDTIVLYGKENFIRKEEHELYKWKPWKKIPHNLVIEHCEESVGMDEKPHKAFREKPYSSIAIALRDHKDGKIDGFVSAGNTGAVMMSSAMILGRIEGVSKPAIAAIAPANNESGRALILDVGANVDIKPQHMLEFAIMGQLYVQLVNDVKTPKVAILSIGEEETKGNQLTLAAYKLLKEKLPNFMGNIEGRDIIAGKADVIVMDGFVGNVVLKLIEGIAGTLFKEFHNIIKKSVRAKVGTVFFNNEIKAIKKNYDYAEYGGAPLLGLAGNVIICHGVSSHVAIRNALRFVKKVAAAGLNKKVEEQLKAATQ